MTPQPHTQKKKPSKNGAVVYFIFAELSASISQSYRGHPHLDPSLPFGVATE